MRKLTDGDWEFVPIDVEEMGHEDLIVAVGRVAVFSAELEAALRLLFYRLMSSDEALVIADGETPDWLLKNCERLINEEHRHEESKRRRRTSLVPLLSECRRTFQDRGIVIHSSWAHNQDGEYIALSSRRHRGLRAYQCTLSEIHELADKFNELAEQVRQVEGFGV